MQAVVLAGGAGRRMWPFGATQAKPLLPVGLDSPLGRILEELARHDLPATVVVSGPHRAALRAFLARRAPSARVVEGTFAGPGEALAAAWPGEGPVLCLYGDVWFAHGLLGRFLQAAAQDPRAVWVLGAPLGGERPGDWLTVDLEGDGSVAALWGHPRRGAHRVGGAFVLPPGFDPVRGGEVRVPVGGMPPAEPLVEGALQGFLEAGGTVRGWVADARAVDLDKPWHLLEANHRAVQELVGGSGGARLHEEARVAPTADLRAPVVLEAGAEIGPGVVVRAPVYLARGARLEDGAIVAGPSLLLPGAVATDYARLDGVVLGPRAVVGHAAEVSGVVMEGVHIVHYSEIYGVVGRQVDIGAATVCGTLRFDDGASRQWVGAPGGPGRWETPPEPWANAAYFGDFSRTGVNVTVLPGRAIGPYSCVGPGVVVAEDVPERTLVLLRQDLERRPWGPERYGW